METLDKVKAILTELSGLESIAATDTLDFDLGLDSLNMVLLLIELEKNFDILLDESDMNPFDLTTVADVVTLVEKYIGDINE